MFRACPSTTTKTKSLTTATQDGTIKIGTVLDVCACIGNDDSNIEIEKVESVIIISNKKEIAWPIDVDGNGNINFVTSLMPNVNEAGSVQFVTITSLMIPRIYNEGDGITSFTTIS